MADAKIQRVVNLTGFLRLKHKQLHNIALIVQFDNSRQISPLEARTNVRVVRGTESWLVFRIGTDPY